MTANAPESNDFEDITLGTPDAVDQVIFEGPGSRHLGGVDPDVNLKRIRLRIGRRPTVRNLQGVYEALGLFYPTELKLFEQYKVWLFSFKLQLMQDGGFRSVRQFGCQVKYPENSAVSIVSLLPDTEFITRAGGEFKAAATLEATGEVKVPAIRASGGGISAQIGAGIHAEANANAKLDLCFSVMSDKVITTGAGDFLGEWSIKKAGKPLLGDQNFLCAVLVPKAQQELAFEIRARVTVGTGYLVPARLNSEWVQMSVSVAADGNLGKDYRGNDSASGDRWRQQ